MSENEQKKESQERIMQVRRKRQEEEKKTIDERQREGEKYGEIIGGNVVIRKLLRIKLKEMRNNKRERKKEKGNGGEFMKVFFSMKGKKILYDETV